MVLNLFASFGWFRVVSLVSSVLGLIISKTGQLEWFRMGSFLVVSLVLGGFDTVKLFRLRWFGPFWVYLVSFRSVQIVSGPEYISVKRNNTDNRKPSRNFNGK